MGVGFSDGTSYADQGEWLAHSNPIPEDVKRIYITPGTSSTNTEMPLGATEKPVGEFKSPGAIQVPAEVGNIDLNTRPMVPTPEGIATVRSMSFGTDKGEVLVPTVHPEGRIMTDDEAISRYYSTGEHLGIFKTPEEATSYAEQLHKDQQAMITGQPIRPEPYGLNPPEGSGRILDATGKFIRNVSDKIGSLPQRAIENSQFSLDTGNYDPRVPVEAAMTGMIAGSPGVVGRQALGAGPAKYDAYIDMFMKQPKMDKVPAKVKDDFEDTLNKIKEALEGIQAKNPGHHMSGEEAAKFYHKTYKNYGTQAAVDFDKEYELLSTSSQWHDYNMSVNNASKHPDSPFFGGYKQGKVPINESGFKPGTPEFDKHYGYKEEPYNPDNWEQELTDLLKQGTPKGWNSLEDMAMEPYVAPPLTAKEKLENQVKEIQNMLFNNSINEKAKAYLEAHKGNIPKEAIEKGYTEPAYRGLTIHGGPGSEVNPTYNFGSHLYSSNSPLLADMYAGYLSQHPGWQVNPGTFSEGATVAPLLINTKNYHIYDAKGAHWQDANVVAIKQARKEGKDGVIVKNVWDEPNSTKALPSAATVYITFERGASTVKSRFAERFDKSSPNMMHMIPVIGVGGAAGYVSMKDEEAR